MKIAIIAATPEMIQLAHEVAEEYTEINITVLRCDLENAAKIALEIESKVDAIISRDGSAVQINRSVKIPVVYCDATPIDFINALYTLQDYEQYIFKGKKIGLFRYEKQSQNVISTIEKIFAVEIKQYNKYQSIDDMRTKVLTAKKDGIDVLIGGINAVETGRELGIKSVFCRTSKENIYESIEAAKKILKAKNTESMQNQWFKGLLNYTNNGIIATDICWRIIFFNSYTEKIVRLTKGLDIREIVKNISLPAIKAFPTPIINQLVDINSVKVILNIIPITVNKKLVGTLFTFIETMKVQEQESTIRANLYSKGQVARYNFSDFIGNSKSTQEIINKARKYAESDFNVFISGESGVGKEIIAQSIHNNSQRKKGPFIAINCTALSDSLLESELFGYGDGAFTGAKKGGKQGLFEIAHGGTIFLDEIGEIPKKVQAELLRVIQEKEVRRIGTDHFLPVDIRIISATNKDLLEEVNKGRFRQDLYYRLNVLTLKIKPLRDRKDDIVPLINHFILKYNVSPNIYIPNEILENHDWPGNVRELENFVARLKVLANDTYDILHIFKEYITHDSTWDKPANNSKNHILLEKGTFEDLEKQIYTILYKETGYNATSLAKLLKQSRTTVWKKLNRFRIKST